MKQTKVYMAACMILLCKTFGGAVAFASEVEFELLKQRLWNKRDAYDTAHYLMLPMHRAWLTNEDSTISAYRRFFEAWANDKQKPPLGSLTELQFAYFASRALVLETSLHGCSDFARNLHPAVASKVEAIANAPAWNWQMPDFPNIPARIQWKIAQVQTSPSYLAAVIDEDLFALALSSDLVVSGRSCGIGPSQMLESLADLAVPVFETAGIFTNDGWLFQPGVWRDHPDYAYAGNITVSKGHEKKIVPGIGMDSSHSARFPLLFVSMACAAVNQDKKNSIGRIRKGFTDQFIKKVVVNDEDGIKIRNFMSGENGIYRYSYATVGEHGGYEPFGLTGTFDLGWYAFIGTSAGDLFGERFSSVSESAAMPFWVDQPIVSDKSAPRQRHEYFQTKKYYGSALHKEVLSSAVYMSNAEYCGAPQ